MIRSQRLVSPDAQLSHGSTPRAAQVSTESITTRVPFGRSSQSSSNSPTISWPGTNGIETSAEKYSLVLPVTMPRSEPQIPDRIGRIRAQPARSAFGSLMVTSRSGAAGPVRMPGMRPPTALAAR